MSTTHEAKSKGFARTVWMIAAALAALLVAAPSPAEAHHGHRHGSHHGVRYHGGYSVGGAVYVPRWIHGPEYVSYRPWYAGQSYFAPHHHAHFVYRFPVLVDGVVVYRPFTYCGDRLVVSAAVPLPRLAIGVQIGPHAGFGTVVDVGPRYGGYYDSHYYDGPYRYDRYDDEDDD